MYFSDVHDRYEKKHPTLLNDVRAKEVERTMLLNGKT